MTKATFSTLSEKDKQLVLETEPKALAKRSEDELLDLHARVRRARNRHTKNYRQGAAKRVGTAKRRSGASKEHSRDRARAEVLEQALARVSRRLGAVARASAEQLKAERLAAARKDKAAKGKGKSKAKGAGKPKGKGKAAKPTRTPASEKRRAATKAKGKQAQAKRDRR